MNAQSPPTTGAFVGVGTLLYTDIRRFRNMPQGLGPVEIAQVMNRHLDYSHRVIEAHGGQVLQFIGDATIAVWRGEPNDPGHARSAFAAGKQLLMDLPQLITRQGGAVYDIGVTLGTGEMAGEFFGPGRQFQIFGMAKAIADRLDRAWLTTDPCIRLSQYTHELLKDASGIEDVMRLPREGLEDLRVMLWRPLASQ